MIKEIGVLVSLRTYAFIFLKDILIFLKDVIGVSKSILGMGAGLKSLLEGLQKNIGVFASDYRKCF